MILIRTLTSDKDEDEMISEDNDVYDAEVGDEGEAYDDDKEI